MIKTIVVTSQFECSMLCSREEACESWNLFETTSGWKCDLNDASTVLEGDLLKKDGAKFGHRLDRGNKKVKTTFRIEFSFQMT